MLKSFPQHSRIPHLFFCKDLEFQTSIHTCLILFVFLGKAGGPARGFYVPVP